jgi:hypothetical protein
VIRGLAAVVAAILIAFAVAASPAGAANGPPAPIETVGPAGVLGSDFGSEASRRGNAPAGASGAFVYRKGRYGPLGVIPGAAPFDHPGFPGATVSQFHFAINNRGETAGSYADAVPGDDGLFPPGSTHGFVKSRRGDVTTFNVPGERGEILVKGNNNRGQVAGVYADVGTRRGPDGLNPPGSVHGFIRQQNGRITTFDVPFPYLHDIGDINDRGQIVGYYDDPDRPYSLPGGFLRQPDGEIVRIACPAHCPRTRAASTTRGGCSAATSTPAPSPTPTARFPRA